MAVKKLLMLGDPMLYRPSIEVGPGEREFVAETVRDLHDTLMDFRKRHGSGRAIAAPQIRVFKRIVYMNTGKPVVFVNPVLADRSEETIELWDDCMSFPGLHVRVRRHRRCRIDYLDAEFRESSMNLEGDISELLQHEVDHLDGILATMRAIDSRSFRIGEISRV